MDDNFEVVNQHLIKYRGNEKVVILPIEVKYIDSYAFYNTIVQRLVISDSVERIYSNAIVSCGTLKEIIISDRLLSIEDNAIRKCNQLKCIYANVGTTGEQYAVKNKIYNVPCECVDSDWHIKNGTVLKCNIKDKCEIIVPENIELIGNSAFANNKRVKKIVLPDTVRKIESKAFLNCSSLREIHISNSIYEISGCAFENCKELEKIILPDSLELIWGNCFSGCSSLKYINIPEGCRNIAGRAFEGCESLEKVRMPKSVERITGNIFVGCSKSLILLVERDSYAHKYAMEYNLKYVFGE